MTHALLQLMYIIMLKPSHVEQRHMFEHRHASRLKRMHDQANRRPWV